jgi:hypothetical protein
MTRSLQFRLVLGAMAGLLFAPAVLRAQAISPIISEYQGKAQGQFQITNDTLFPLDVVLEPFSFMANEKGQPVYGPLEPNLHVRLSATSFRLSPKQVYTVYYDASADVLPAWFSIYATVTRANNHSDVRVAFQLPHTVYLLPSTTINRESVQVTRIGRLANGEVGVEIENRGKDYARVQEVDLITSSGKKVFPGFPFFPHQRRIIVLPPDRGAEPQKVVIKFPKFKVEEPVEGSGASR